MRELKEVYDVKKRLIADNDMDELREILSESEDIKTIDMNSDNSIYVEFNEVNDTNDDSLLDGISRFFKNKDIPSIYGSIVYSKLPLSRNSCIIRI